MIADNASRPYAYGQWDCLLFPAAAVAEVTGTDYGKGHRGKYKSAASASRYLRSLGHATPESYLDSMFPQKPIGFAQRGDLVLCDLGAVEAEDSPSGPVPGVCMGDFALCLAAIEGAQVMARVPRQFWLKAWAIGGNGA